MNIGTVTTGMHYLDARAPEGMRIYAIGDVHGRLDLLLPLHQRIVAELQRDRPADWRVVHLGDYVDRGPQSRGVVELLMKLQAHDPRYVMLAGNHDVGLVDFLMSPVQDSLFIEFGGIQTARSYGVTYEAGRGLDQFCGELIEAIPLSHLQFLQNCAPSAAFGDFFFCHAGVRPNHSLDEQESQDLMWIRRGFLDHDGLLEKVIVHGHTVTREPEVLPYRVNIDTGAWKSGVLTALCIDGDRKRLIMASDR